MCPLRLIYALTTIVEKQLLLSSQGGRGRRFPGGGEIQKLKRKKKTIVHGSEKAPAHDSSATSPVLF